MLLFCPGRYILHADGFVFKLDLYITIWCRCVNQRCNFDAYLYVLGAFFIEFISVLHFFSTVERRPCVLAPFQALRPARKGPVDRIDCRQHAFSTSQQWICHSIKLKHRSIQKTPKLYVILKNSERTPRNKGKNSN